jgi:DNA-directed RNA polymerase specialized sigma24 family protein
LTRDKVELEHKLAWRYQQQEKILVELQKCETRPTLKELARLLNVPLGTICSKVARARKEFGQKLKDRGIAIDVQKKMRAPDGKGDSCTTPCG